MDYTWFTQDLSFCKISVHTVQILSSCREEKDEKKILTKKEENQLEGEIIGI